MYTRTLSQTNAYLGIGSSNPQKNLHVNGDALVNGTSYMKNIVLGLDENPRSIRTEPNEVFIESTRIKPYNDHLYYCYWTKSFSPIEKRDRTTFNVLETFSLSITGGTINRCLGGDVIVTSDGSRYIAMSFEMGNNDAANMSIYKTANNVRLLITNFSISGCKTSSIIIKENSDGSFAWKFQVMGSFVQHLLLTSAGSLICSTYSWSSSSTSYAIKDSRDIAVFQTSNILDIIPTPTDAVGVMYLCIGPTGTIMWKTPLYVNAITTSCDINNTDDLVCTVFTKQSTVYLFDLDTRQVTGTMVNTDPQRNISITLLKLNASDGTTIWSTKTLTTFDNIIYTNFASVAVTDEKIVMAGTYNAFQPIVQSSDLSTFNWDNRTPSVDGTNNVFIVCFNLAGQAMTVSEIFGLGMETMMYSGYINCLCKTSDGGFIVQMQSEAFNLTQDKSNGPFDILVNNPDGSEAKRVKLTYGLICVVNVKYSRNHTYEWNIAHEHRDWGMFLYYGAMAELSNGDLLLGISLISYATDIVQLIEITDSVGVTQREYVPKGTCATIHYRYTSKGRYANMDIPSCLGLICELYRELKRH